MGQIHAASIAPLQREGMREPAVEAVPRERLALLQLQRLRSTLVRHTCRGCAIVWKPRGCRPATSVTCVDWTTCSGCRSR
jgi:hypothetical protein